MNFEDVGKARVDVGGDLSGVAMDGVELDNQAVDRGEILKLLKKRAEGFSVAEVNEEFALVDGELKLIKRKVANKFFPPQLPALKLLLDLQSPSPPTSKSLSLAELEAERYDLLSLLHSEEEEED